jgi:excisionase family DNA binding protein
MTDFQTQFRCYTVAEVAVILGVSRDVAYRMARLKTFPTLRLGKIYRIPIAPFEEWMTSGCPAPAVPTNTGRVFKAGPRKLA